ncbi:hypothetical protein JJB07_10245 [Tumebacillus sp. ITR2]|uniref:Uncharacterized protein n=1 Tax=Tumebacillus amylolyticus TaxID=2801339 RepID=A0ABS1J9X7_9BACL|nr:hypothetical protein [Tumebacillus amylolyticus]MBL0387030.1 hypothetical protein [Tumebacillus amylolyticus]
MKIALPFAVLTLALLLLGSLLTLTTKDLRMTEDLITSEQADALAEAGLLHAEMQLASDPSWRGSLQNLPCGPGTYSVTLIDFGGGNLSLESIGRVGRSKRIWKKTVSFPSKH